MKLNYQAFQSWADKILSNHKLSDTGKIDIQSNYESIFNGADILDDEVNLLNDNEQELAQDYIENAIFKIKGEKDKINYSRKEFGLVSPNQSNRMLQESTLHDSKVYNKSVYDSAIKNITLIFQMKL